MEPEEQTELDHYARENALDKAIAFGRTTETDELLADAEKFYQFLKKPG